MSSQPVQLIKFNIITLFPEMFSALTEHGITGRAFRKKLIELTLLNPRQQTHNIHQTVDDRPFGGGPGMVMMYQPLADTLPSSASKTILMSPQGQPLTQSIVLRLAKEVQQTPLTIVCGRYEGIDQRFIDEFVDEEISIGDFVVSGGEIPCMTLLDGIIRTLPNALGDANSAQEDSFSYGLLDFPQYTRPARLPNERSVPDVLLNGNHKAIAQWRRFMQLKNTWLRRPDLLDGLCLSPNDAALLEDIKRSIDEEQKDK